MEPTMKGRVRTVPRLLLVAAAALLALPEARGDAVVDWNVRAGEIVAGARVNPAVANRVMAIMHAAVYEAASAVAGRDDAASGAARGASIDAAVAAASRATLARLLPAQAASIEAAYATAIAIVPDGPGRADGIAAGEAAAAAVLARRAADGAEAAETYRPITSPGVWVPTVIPAVPQWPGRKPWLMNRADQFRPGPPPRLDSEIWARDVAEVKALGARDGSRRTPEQTEIARFWEATLPPIYHGVVRSVATAPGRDATRNARLFAAVTEATDDALISVFDAKYHHGFWRPITAIRNADLGGSGAIPRDASWTPLVETPMHPEYPCAHCIVASAVATVLRSEVGDGPVPTLTTTSPTAGGASRSWSRLDDFVREVAEARICGGVHYRNSTEVGIAMGKRVGELAVAKVLGPGAPARGDRAAEPGTGAPPGASTAGASSARR
jgi:hypothetical protein